MADRAGPDADPGGPRHRGRGGSGRILIDAAHDFGKNTWHSLEVTRRLGEMVATGLARAGVLSNKDFHRGTLDAPPDRRLTGTWPPRLSVAWLGARVFRVHQVSRPGRCWPWCRRSRATSRPARTVRGLA